MSQTPIAPVGMVDELAPTPRLNTPFEQAVLAFIMHTGPSDPAVLARLQDPATRAALAAAEVEQRARDWPHLGQYRGENAEQKNLPRPKVVFVGNSITELWRYADPPLFSDGIIGRGISGQTSPQVLLRFYADVIAHKPKAVHILCGGNDIAGNTGPSTLEDYQNNILAMLDLAQLHGVNVLLGSITPAAQYGWRPEVKPIPWVGRINAWLSQIAQERGAIYIDYFSVLATEDRSMRADYTNDGVHPNAAGYAAMKPLALAAIEKALAASA